MPVNLAARAVTKLPWTQIIALLPAVAKAARSVWNHWEGKPNPEIDPGASVEQQLQAISKRIVALEANEKSQAEVVSQIVEQLEGLAVGLKETSARQAASTRISVVAVVLAAAAVVAAFLA